MEANRYYSVSFDERNYPSVKKLRRRCGGIIAYGRWEALKQLLFDADGRLAADDPDIVGLIIDELEFGSREEYDRFIQACIDFGLIDSAMFREAGSIISPEVAETLEYRRKQAEFGKKGGRPKKNSPR